MFKDREKALEELQRLLEDEEEEAQYEEDSQEEQYDEDSDDDSQEDEETVDLAATRRVQVYNADTTDTDLEDYSRDVYETPQNRRGGCALWFVLLTAAVLLAISWFLAKERGLL